ncbi:MAG: molecular chaperone TorD family protein [Cocleimonas sp.]
MSSENMSQAQALKIDSSTQAQNGAHLEGYSLQETDQQPEQQYRAAAYSILATLLRGIPSQEALDQISEFSKVAVSEDELLLSMSSLGLAAQSTEVAAIDDEYHLLFVGLGRGELVPYGSWYLTGFLMEQPLSVLRDDLRALGFERDESIVEPEDHVAAICEIMMMLISDNPSGSDENQVIFFEKHIVPWMERFFKDLSEAESAVFYRAVGRFGLAFLDFEKQYLLV